MISIFMKKVSITGTIFVMIRIMYQHVPTPIVW